MSLFKRITSLTLALLLMAISFPVSVFAAEDWTKNLSESGWTYALDPEGKFSIKTTETSDKYYRLSRDSLDPLAFRTGGVYSSQVIKISTPAMYYNVALEISQLSDTALSAVNKELFLNDAPFVNKQWEGVSYKSKDFTTVALVRDSLLRKFFNEVGYPEKLTDPNKARAVASVISQIPDAELTPFLLDSFQTRGNVQDLSDIARIYESRADALSGNKVVDDQTVIIETNGAKYGELYAYVYNYVVNAPESVTENGKILYDFFGASISGIDTFAGTRKAVVDVLVQELGTATRDRIIANILAAALYADSDSTSKFPVLSSAQIAELISLPYTPGAQRGLNVNNPFWNNYVATKFKGGESAAVLSSTYVEPLASLTERIKLIDEAKTLEQSEKLRKTLGTRMQISWALSKSSYAYTESLSPMSLSRVTSIPVGADIRASYQIPLSNVIGSANLLGRDVLEDGMSYSTYLELKTEMAEMQALAYYLDQRLQIERVRQDSAAATSSDKNMFQLLDDIRIAIQFINSNDYGPAVLRTQFNKIWTEVLPGSQQQVSLEAMYNALSGLALNPDLAEFIVASDAQPLREFINITDSTIQNSLSKGIALSSTFLPFRTNIYDVTAFKPVATDDEFLDFHAQYGYDRKALFIDTNVKSVTEFYNTSGRYGNIRLCTLNDLLQPEKEIQLFTDDNFYNAHKLQSYQEAELGRLDNTSDSETTKTGWEDFWMKVGNIFKFNILDVLKTAEKTEYSDKLSGIKSYAESKKEGYVANNEKEAAILSGSQIQSQLDENSGYSVMRAFAFTSAVYRSSELFNLTKRVGVEPVFQSSKNVVNISGASPQLKYSIFNYALLKNIQGGQAINYASTLDKDRPVYMDVYGNILTESGYVVIPAAANATLFNTYNLRTAAWLDTYGNQYHIPSSVKWISQSTVAELMTTDNTSGDIWTMVPKALGSVDYNRLDTSSEAAQEDLMRLAIEHLNDKQLRFDNYVRNVFLEVMRGAPLENIDKDVEGLMPNVKLSRSGIVQAGKLDSLKESLKGASQNSILAIPNLAFVEGLEYVVLFVYKLSLLICTIMLLTQIFIKSLQHQFGIRTVISMFMTIALTLTAIWAIPLIYDLSYYQSNKMMLQTEAERISMLNLEKTEAGMEIGITEVRAPDISTEFLLKVKDVNIPWYDAFYEIMFAPIDSTLEGIYRDYAETDPVMHEPQFEFRAGSLYVPVSKLFETSTVLLDPRLDALTMTTTADTPASFYTPYYVFLQTLTSNVNQYNIEQNAFTYTTANYSGGKKKSLGLIRNYLTSDEFIDADQSRDLLSLYVIYGKMEGMSVGTIFTPEDIESMQKSQWHLSTINDTALHSRVDKMDNEARLFVARNKALLGKISDETFLKSMALHLALEYNKLFNIQSMDSLELYNLSPDDLTRASVARSEDVIAGSTMSFTRFIYTTGGETAVYAAGLLTVVNFVSDWAKPIITLFILLAVFVSLFIYKIILGRKADSLRGYAYLVLAISGTNFLYSLMYKITIALPGIGFSPTVCILIQVALQILLLSVLGYLAGVAITNWRDLGSTKFTALGLEIKHEFTKSRLMELISKRGTPEAENSKGWRVYNGLKDTDAVRKYNAADEE